MEILTFATPRRATPRRGHRRGFSFVEILFAIIVLGIGFILIAAIFPVAISQSQATIEETAAVRVLANATQNVPGVVSLANVPATGRFVGLAVKPGVYLGVRDPRSSDPTETLWQSVKGSLIDSSDARFAWTFVYRRDVDAANTPLSPTAIFVGLTSRNRVGYSPDDLFRWDAGTTSTAIDGGAKTYLWATLQPKIIRVITINRGGTDTVEVMPAAGTTPTTYRLERVDGSNVPVNEVPDYTAAVAEGSYIVISDDNVQPPYDTFGSYYSTTPFSPAKPYVPGTLNGRIYRVGSLSTEAPAIAGNTVWELQPGFDLKDDTFNLPINPADRTTAGTTAVAFVFGKGYANVREPAGSAPAGPPYAPDLEGRTQDVRFAVGGLQ